MAQANIDININDQSIGELEAKLAQLNEEIKQVGVNSSEFQKISKEIRQVQGEVDNANKKIQGINGAQAAGEFAALAGGIAAAGSALGAFSDDNEQVQQSIQRLTAVLGAASFAEQIFKITSEESAAAQVISTVATNAASAAQAAYTAVVGTSTGALKLFRLALISTGIGAIVVAIGLLVANWDKLVSAIKESNIGLKEIGNVLLFIAPPIGLVIKAVEFLGEKLGGLENIIPAITGAFKAFFTEFTDIASNIGTVLTGLFTFDLEKIKEGVNGAKAILKKGAQDGVREAEEERRKQQRIEDNKALAEQSDFLAKKLEAEGASQREIAEQRKIAADARLEAAREEFGEETEEYKEALLAQLQAERDFNKTVLEEKLDVVNQENDIALREARLAGASQERIFQIRRRGLERQLELYDEESDEYKDLQLQLRELAKETSDFRIAQAEATAERLLDIEAGITDAIASEQDLRINRTLQIDIEGETAIREDLFKRRLIQLDREEDAEKKAANDRKEAGIITEEEFVKELEEIQLRYNTRKRAIERETTDFISGLYEKQAELINNTATKAIQGFIDTLEDSPSDFSVYAQFLQSSEIEDVLNEFDTLQSQLQTKLGEIDEEISLAEGVLLKPLTPEQREDVLATLRELEFEYAQYQDALTEVQAQGEEARLKLAEAFVENLVRASFVSIVPIGVEIDPETGEEIKKFGKERIDQYQDYVDLVEGEEERLFLLLKEYQAATQANEGNVFNARFQNYIKSIEAERSYKNQVLDTQIDILEAENKVLEKRKKALDAALSEGLLTEEEYAEQVKEVVQQQADNEVEINKKKNEQIVNNEEAAAEKRKELLEDIFESFNRVLDLLSAISANITEQINGVTISFDQRAQAIEDYYAKEVQAAGDNADRIVVIEAEKEAAILANERQRQRATAELQIKQAKLDFAITVGQTIANTASAIMKAFSDLGPIAGAVAAAAITATGAIQINTAKQARDNAIAQAEGGDITFNPDTRGIGETPGFATGGLVSGPGTGTSDSITARLSDGEFVVNAEATERFLPVLEAINYGQPGFAQGGLVTTSSSSENTELMSRIAMRLEQLETKIDRPLKAYVVSDELRENLDQNAYLERRANIT